MKNYLSEKEGQLEFYETFWLSGQVKYEDYTDGVVNGNIFEFKKTISNLNVVLFQSIKYMSRMRIMGKSVPANIFLVDLNKEVSYRYNSSDFLTHIEIPYSGASSKDNDDFITPIKPDVFNYGVDGVGKLKKYINENEDNYIKIHIDENCAIGWAERFYRENPKKTKAEMFAEFESPSYFSKYIYPFEGDRRQFKHFMDMLNDKLHKKELGAFYTPPAYCKLLPELVEKALEQTKKDEKGNKRYIILDRCAGTGNLEEFLTEEQLRHCILSTYEYFEYEVLKKRYENKVLAIIPPNENRDDLLTGKIIEADALSETYLNNSLIKEYVLDKSYTIILLENPPFSDSSGDNKEIGEENRKGHKGVVYEEFKKEICDNAAHRDLVNLFIWSAWKYYLRNPSDCYILFSPIKYWKSLELSSKKLIDGYLFNRGFFHNSESAISCILWQNINENKENINLKAIGLFDGEKEIRGGKKIEVKDDWQSRYIKDVQINKVHNNFTAYQDKRTFDTDVKGVCCNSDGRETNKDLKSKIPLYNKNIIGYMFAKAYPVDPKHYGLFRCIEYQCLIQSYGFYLRSDNFIEKLPIFCAKNYPQKKWYERDVYFTTSDKGNEYLSDKEFLKCCLIWTCLSRKNKCLSFDGLDGRHYKNELCFDGNTLATQELKKFDLLSDDKEVIDLFREILDQAKLNKTGKFNPSLNYGVYQIDIDVNIFTKNDDGSKQYIDSELNSKIEALRGRLSTYYEKHVQPKLFKYELLK